MPHAMRPLPSRIPAGSVLRRLELGVVPAVLICLFCTSAHGQAIVQWTGGAGSPFWSHGGNWLGGLPPAVNDVASFNAAPPPSGRVVVDAPVSIGKLVLESSGAAFDFVVGGDSQSLVLTGLGIEALTRVGGPSRLTMSAAPGATGGVIRFAGTSSINPGTATFYRAVDLVAEGGAAPAAVGGRIVFQDDASTGVNTLNTIQANGATVAGALGGEILFRDRAQSVSTLSLFVRGGTGAGAQGAVGSFIDSARVEGLLYALAGADGGLGGRMTFAGDARAGGLVANSGALPNSPGASGLTVFRDRARLDGSARNLPGTADGATGGVLEFRDQAAFIGSASIVNQGSSFAGASAGFTAFRGDSFADGTSLRILNDVDSEGGVPGTAGGATGFYDRSQARSVTIWNVGAVSRSLSPVATQQGRTAFHDSSSAGTASIENFGGTQADALGGRTQFLGTATAATATIVNRKGETALAGGGWTEFFGSSDAGNAYIANEANDSTSQGLTGATFFWQGASAGRARIDNFGSLGGPFRSETRFAGSATAANARIASFGGQAAHALGGFVSFYETASAGSAFLLLGGGTAPGSFGGSALFTGIAGAAPTAADAVFDVRAGVASSARGGVVTFAGHSDAGRARFDVQGAAVPSVLAATGDIFAEAGVVYFEGDASAADAVFTLGAGEVTRAIGGRAQFAGNSNAGRAQFLVKGQKVLAGGAGETRFTGSSSAADARFDVQAIAAAGASFGGFVGFYDTATAGRAQFRLQGATVFEASFAPSGWVQFFGNASAGDAHFDAFGGRAAGVLGGAVFFIGNTSAERASFTVGGGSFAGRGGYLRFSDASSAGRASIVLQGGEGAGSGGGVYFIQSTSAADATITARGSASVGAGSSGFVQFSEASSAGNATLVAEGSTSASPDSPGGRIIFATVSSGDRSRVVLRASTTGGGAGTLDIAQAGRVVAYGLQGIQVGSLEGDGRVVLGSKTLFVGAETGRDTTFSGVIEDGGAGGGLAVLSGTLRLTGSNPYAGATYVAGRGPAHPGKLVVTNTTGSATGTGPVYVEDGGTLAGSGTVAGPVFLRAGGTIAPGDPVTLTLLDSLTWDGGGVIELVVGADSQGSDRLVLGSLRKGAPGVHRLHFIDAGFQPGQVYELLLFGSLVDFAPQDFVASGIDGSFALGANGLVFTAAVPEPVPSSMLVSGLVLLWMSRRVRAPRRS